ncbi:tRNA (guanosine(18)-2'-O)-methyltransferase [mine drainage metagenome]|uniref:tRNA (Guanosine(18)-2'-O)-methyltransferase n=1 Tax=mine drainage metagenome TaxID=410659 RepID=A0A1J5SFR6_9ZZZZ
MKHLRSRDNPSFKALRVLAGDAREQRRTGLSLLEGSHLVAAYRDKVGPPERLVVSERGAAQPEIMALQASLAGVDTLLLTDSLFAELSGVATPSGILALIRIPAVTEAAAIFGSCVLLDALQDAGNVGSILRSAAAAGIGEVFLGKGCAGAWTPRVLRAAQGAHFDLIIREQADLVQVIESYPGTVIAATTHDAVPLYRLDLTGAIAWLFGNEGAGVAPELLRLALARAAIPMAPGSESLNVAAAAAVCLFEEVRQKHV